MHLSLKKDDQAVKTLKGVLRKCEDHLPESNFRHLMFENPFRDTAAIHPRLNFYDGKFGTKFYEGDTEVDSEIPEQGVLCEISDLS